MDHVSSCYQSILRERRTHFSEEAYSGKAKRQVVVLSVGSDEPWA